jgi:hypothetical protein
MCCKKLPDLPTLLVPGVGSFSNANSFVLDQPLTEKKADSNLHLVPY